MEPGKKEEFVFEIPRDTPLSEFKQIRVIKEKPDTMVSLVDYKGRKCILKAFQKQKIMDDESKKNEVLNERDLLKKLSHPFLNKLLTTTKSDEQLCLVLDIARGIDMVQFLRSSEENK